MCLIKLENKIKKTASTMLTVFYIDRQPNGFPTRETTPNVSGENSLLIEKGYSLEQIPYNDVNYFTVGLNPSAVT